MNGAKLDSQYFHCAASGFGLAPVPIRAPIESFKVANGMTREQVLMAVPRG